MYQIIIIFCIKWSSYLYQMLSPGYLPLFIAFHEHDHLTYKSLSYFISNIIIFCIKSSSCLFQMLSPGYLPLFIAFPRTWSFNVQIIIIFCIKSSSCMYQMLSRGYLPLFIEFPRTWSFEVQIVIIFCIKYLSYFVSNHHHICIKWCLEDISHYLWISHAHDHLKYHQVPSNKNELMRGMGNK